MFWNKKESGKMLPDLPPISPRFSSFNDESYPAESRLPSFPDSMSDRGFSQAAIKGAVNQGGEMPRTVEMEEWAPNSSQVEMESEEEEMMPAMNEAPQRIAPPPIQRIEKTKNSDVFVKLDKFYSARKALSDAQEKLADVDNLFRKIREVKMREEQELAGWESELQKVKARINEVVINIFEKVD